MQDRKRSCKISKEDTSSITIKLQHRQKILGEQGLRCMADEVTSASKLLEVGKYKIEEPTKYYRQPSQRKHEIEGGEKSLEKSFSFKRS